MEEDFELSCVHRIAYSFLYCLFLGTDYFNTEKLENQKHIQAHLCVVV